LRPTRRQVRTCSTRRVSGRSRRSAPSAPPSRSPSTSWPFPPSRSRRSSRREHNGSASEEASPGSRGKRWPTPPSPCATKATCRCSRPGSRSATGSPTDVRTTWLFVGLTAAVTAGAAAAHYAHATSGLTFGLSTLALAGLAWIVSFSTEQVGERFGPGVTGVMQSTLGNLPEFFVVIFALSQGEVVVAQTSIIGSVFANALLVLGLVIIAGCSASSDGLMRFSVRLPKDNAILLMLASFVIVILGISIATGDRASHHVEALPIPGAVALLGTYLVWIVDSLRSDAPGEPSHGEPALPLTTALVLLALAGVGAAFVSDWFVTALSPTMDRLGIPKAFA